MALLHPGERRAPARSPQRWRTVRAARAVRAARTAAGLAASLLVGGAIAQSGATSAAAAPSRPPTVQSNTTPFPDGLVHVDGHGWGPGVGMGQWGAFGYAAVEHEPYQWILSHFYGGTSMASTTDRYISVGIIENSGAPLVVTSSSKFRLGGVKIPAGDAARAVLDGSTGTWNVDESSSCSGSGGWKRVASGVAALRGVPASQQADAPTKDLLTICRADGVQMTVRGFVQGEVNRSNGSDIAETVNWLPLDEYVTDVVPSESSSGWGESGGTSGAPQGEPWGFQELEAQAVAARTYTLAYSAGGGWDGYADICDSDYCQTYPGILNESDIATRAVTDTAGQYLTLNGNPAPTQYSASTGGWTVQSQFPAVVDEGDSVCLQNTGYWTCNDEHSWQVTIPVKSVESTFPSIGALEAVHVLTRNGLGEWGGRALTIKIRGSKGSVVESGDTFEWQFGLYSNWFLIAHPSTSPTSTSTPSFDASPGPAASGTGPLPGEASNGGFGSQAAGGSARSRR